MSSGRGNEEERLGGSEHGEWTLTRAVPHRPLGRKCRARTEAGGQTQVRTNSTAQNVGTGSFLPLTQVFLHSLQTLFQSLPSKSLSFELSSKKER